ncbi:MAG: amidohydrolase [Actinomycetota bacterium]
MTDSSSQAAPLNGAPDTVRLVADYVVPGEGRGLVIAGGAVDIGADGRITAVGPEAELAASEPAPSRTERVGGLIAPGLVNAHAHTPMTLVRSVGDGLPLDRWLREGVWPLEGRMNPDDARAGMLAGSVEMLLGGVTTSCEMYLFEGALADATRDSGARLVMTPGVIAALAPDGDVGPRIDEIAIYHQSNHDPEARLHVGFAPHSIYDLSPEQCGEIAARAQKADALFHIHLEETQAERDLVIERHGASATQLLADHGALDGQVLAAHGVYLDAGDRRLLAEAGAAVAHCPQSNLKLGSGIADVPTLLADGVGVGVGTDGPASNDDLDMWEELRLAALLARGSHRDPTVIDAALAFELATRRAAAAIGLDDVGELRVGAWADVIAVDLDHPRMTPRRDDTLLTQLVFAGAPELVRHVWVAGERVVRDGAMVDLDVDEVRSDAQQRALRLSS